jgi:putative peptidoglycan lipid II flippase
MIPAVIGLSATQINIFINTNFATSCPEGSVSWLQYAFRLVQLPIGIFGVAIGIAVMPLLARHSANKNIEGLKETFISSLIMVFCLTIPAGAGLYFLSEPIIRLVFERGAFSAVDTIATAQALSLYSIGLFAYSSNKVLVPVFYALEKTRYPVIASFITVCTNILFISLTIDYFQHRAIALSVSISMLINFFFLSIIVYRELHGFSVKYVAVAVLKILLATSVMSFFVIQARHFASAPLSGNPWQSASTLLFIISAALVLYSALIYLLKVNEFSEVMTKLKGRFFKRR